LREPNKKWNVYGKLGVSIIDNEATDSRVPFDRQTSAQLALGAGLQLRFSDQWFSRLELDSFDRDANYIGLSIGAYLGRL